MGGHRLNIYGYGKSNVEDEIREKIKPNSDTKEVYVFNATIKTSDIEWLCKCLSEKL
jgi:hypothetical protein